MKAVAVAISFRNGRHALPRAVLANRLVPFQIPAQTKLDMNHKFARIMQDFMVPGHLGQDAVLHVAVDSKLDQNNIHVVARITSKNVPVMKTQVITNNGVNGVIVLFHVAVEMLFDNVFTVVLVKFKLIQNSVTLIHAVITVPGQIGHHAVPHVVSEPCLECDIATVVVLVTDSAFLVTSPLTKLLNAKWVTVAILIGQDGLVVVATLATKMLDCDSVEAALDHPPRKFQNHVTSLVSSVTPVWSSFKILMN